MTGKSNLFFEPESLRALLERRVDDRDAGAFSSIADRKSDMIIRGGENLYPREIDELLYTSPGNRLNRRHRRSRPAAPGRKKSPLSSC